MTKIEEENEKLYYDYTFDYCNKCISDSYFEIKKGNIVYLYKKSVVEQVTEKLDKNNIAYVVKEKDDYYEIMPANFRKKVKKNA